jgi:hypothetical protein
LSRPPHRPRASRAASARTPLPSPTVLTQTKLCASGLPGWSARPSLYGFPNAMYRVWWDSQPHDSPAGARVPLTVPGRTQKARSSCAWARHPQITEVARQNSSGLPRAPYGPRVCRAASARTALLPPAVLRGTKPCALIFPVDRRAYRPAGVSAPGRWESRLSRSGDADLSGRGPSTERRCRSRCGKAISMPALRKASSMAQLMPCQTGT